MTLTSVGYGDVVPVGNASRVYAVVVMLIGSGLFGAMISGCSLVIQRLVNNEARNKVAELALFMNRRAVPKHLQFRVRENLRKHLDYANSASLAPDVLASLSPAMQRELCLSILEETILGFPLFYNAQRSFVAELAQ